MILPGVSTFTQNDTVTTLLSKAQKAKNIKIIDQVTQEELKNYYQKAKLFVFPSFHESFGFPPLEAMACGTPVIVSNVTALPEVCGDAALYVNPHSITDITEKLQLLLSDEALRKSYRAKGLEHVKQYTWERAARAHLNIFKEVDVK
jgi:glycosyltransferase involved in cell wall biosynthesis